jgi:maleylacetate reductase
MTTRFWRRRGFWIVRLIAESPHARVAFGPGALSQLGGLLDGLAVGRVLVVTTTGRSSSLEPILKAAGSRITGVAPIAREHVPSDVVRHALEEVDRLRADAVLAVGGGSAIGLAKAIALERGVPVAAVPTTYSGSEMTSIFGVTDGAVKRTGRDVRVAPRVVVYDPTLTLTLPAAVSAASGMNAIAHAVEATYAPNLRDDVSSVAREAIRLLSESLPVIVKRLDDVPARTAAFAGAQAAGVALERAAMGLHHKICHVLGGSFGLPHALTHAVVLPHVVAFNAPAAPDAMAAVAAALGTDEAEAGLHALNRALGLTKSLTDLGFDESDIPRAAELVATASYPNPRPASADDVRGILTRASRP